MKKLEKILLLLIILLMTIVSCSKDKNINNIQNEKKYEKIVILDPAVVEMMYLLGAEDKIVGVATLQKSKIWPEEKVEKLEKVGTFIQPSVEKILSLKPELVIISAHSNEELNNVLKNNNIEIKQIVSNSTDEIFNNFKEIAKMVGKEEVAEKIITDQKSKLEKIKEENKINQKGMFVLSTSPLMAFGNNTLPNDIMKIWNIKNIAENLEGTNPIMTPEYVIKENPEIIISMTQNPNEILTANPQLKDIQAIKSNKIILVDSSQVLRGSPRTIDHIIEVYEKVKK